MANEARSASLEAAYQHKVALLNGTSDLQQTTENTNGNTI